MRKEKQVKIGDEQFTVREVCIGDVIDILPRLGDGGKDAQEAQMDMVQASVLLKGKPINVREMGLSAYMVLAKEVLEVNGMGKNEQS